MKKAKEVIKEEIKSGIADQIQKEEIAGVKADIKAEIQTERQEDAYTLPQRFLYEVTKLVPIIVIVILSSFLMMIDTNLWCFRWIREVPQLVLATVSLSVTAFVLCVINIILTWLWPSFHKSNLLREIEKSSIASAMAFVAFIIFTMFLIWITMQSVAHGATLCQKQTVDKAKPYLSMMADTFNQYWPDAPMKYIEPGKLDRETACPNIKKCWNPYVELKTSREWGIGLSEITKTWNKDGTVRFDNWTEAKRKYKEQLAGWNFEGDAKYEAKYHIIYSILEDKGNYKRMAILFENTIDRWAGTLVSYNAGGGRVNSRFAICKITEGCDTSKWFGGLETVSSSAEKKSVIYGVSLQKRVNDYPFDVIFKRSLKYIGEL